MKKTKCLHWTKEQDAFLAENYPSKGKMFCANALGVGEASIRWRASKLGIKIDRNGDFFKDFQKRAAQSKVGKKRPAQSLIMKKLLADGKLNKTVEQRKAISERMKIQWKKQPHPRGMLGKKHTPEVLVILSQRSKENHSRMTEDDVREKTRKMIETKVARGNLVSERPNASWKSGWRDIGEKPKYYRSKWEANYARYLEFLKVQGKIRSWAHEPKVFWFEGIKRGCVSYLPDFLVVENDGSEVYHEVKGWMDDRSKTKIARMARYFPDVKLIVIDERQYKSIAKTASKLIPGWE